MLGYRPLSYHNHLLRLLTFLVLLVILYQTYLISRMRTALTVQERLDRESRKGKNWSFMSRISVMFLW